MYSIFHSIYTLIASFQVQSGCLLLKIGFMTLSDYLFLLHASSEALSPLGSHVMFYLAAAVSDFYVPENEIVRVFLIHTIFFSAASFIQGIINLIQIISFLCNHLQLCDFIVCYFISGSFDGLQIRFFLIFFLCYYQ